jgi:hypothetical protein
MLSKSEIKDIGINFKEACNNASKSMKIFNEAIDLWTKQLDRIKKDKRNARRRELYKLKSNEENRRS